MVPHYPGSFTGSDNQHPCSNPFLSVWADWYVLYNPPIRLSAQDPAISQSFDASEAMLSPLTVGNVTFSGKSCPGRTLTIVQ